MKILCKLTRCLVFLMALLNACASRQETGAAPVGDNAPYITSKMDTSVRLKFTSGVRSILEDSKGNIWFGSHQEGACRFDGEKLTYFTVEDGLSDNQIRSIYEDSNGRVWFEGGKGISRFDGKSISIYTKKDYNAGNDWQTGSDDLWFKGDEASGYNVLEGQPGMYRYDGHSLRFYTFPLAPKTEEPFHYSVSTPFVKGKNGRYWFGTYGAVVGYDGISFMVFDDERLGLNDATGHLHVRSIFEDSKGILWIGNNGIGVLRYDGDTTVNFSELHGLVPEYSLRIGGYRSPAGSLEHVFSIGEDTNGNMWFGDRDTGAWRYDGKSLKNYTTKDGLTTTHIWQIYKSKTGELWFAMGDGSVCRFNGKSFDRIF